MVLIAEDDDLMNELLNTVGKRYGEIRSHKKADAALAAFENAVDRFKLVILDIRFASKRVDLDGVHLARAIRKRRPHIPIFIFSALTLETEPDTKNKLDELGVHYIHKNKGLVYLAQAIDEVMTEG